jgi:protoporphyrinogen/coproporphyrinogen III oxidase
MKRLVIIGGGIAGLSAAWEAARHGAPRDGTLRDGAPRDETLDITLIERDHRLGGKIRTDSVDGFLLEAGPDSFLTTRPDVPRLCDELGIADRLVPRTPRKGHSFIMHGHTLSPLPDGFSGTVPMDTAALAVSPLLSEAGKRRVLEGPEMPAWTGGDDESVASFIVRRFGEEAFELLFEPLLGGIHAGDASLLSREAILHAPHRTADAGPRPPAAPSASAAAARPGHLATTGAPAAPFLSFPRGTSELVSALEEHLSGVTILRGTVAESVRRHVSGYDVELSGGVRRPADAVILATPAHETARLIAPLDPGMQELLGLIPFASSVVIHLAYRRADVSHPLEGYGYLIPSVERSDLVACTWSSQKWEGRAPEDHVLLRLFAGRFGRRDLLGRSDEELFRLARGECAATLGITAEPVLQRLHRWDLGMPQYTVGHVRRVEAITARAAALPGLFLAGSSYGGVGIPQCVESGAAAAAAALSYLQGVRS